TAFTVDFSQPLDTSTLQASDFTANGTPADSFSLVDANTVTFQYAASPVAAEGLQTMSMAAGSVRASGGVADPSLRAWSKTFRYDAVPMQVVATSPASGGFLTLSSSAPTTLQLTLNEAVDPGSVGTDDLTLSQGRVTAASVSPDGITITYALD